MTGPRGGSSFFSTSTPPHNRIRPTLTVSRPKRSPQTAHPQHQQQPQPNQEVLPPNQTSASSSPSVGRIAPLRPREAQTRGSNRGDATHNKQSNHHQNEHGPRQGRSNPWLYHIIETRRAAIRAFVSGTILTGGALGIYNVVYSSSPIVNQWTQLQQDFMSLARASLTQHPGAAAVDPISSPTQAALVNGGPRSFSSSPAEQPMTIGRFEKKIKMLSSEQVEERLAQNQRSFKITPDAVADRRDKPKQDLVLGYCVNQVASNNPVEDDLSGHVIRGKDGSIEKVFFGVFDGHGGWCCSQKVAQELAPTVATELDALKDQHDVMAVMEAIENGFLKLDDKIVNQTVQTVLEFPSRPLACSSLLPAISGSCALLAYVDAKEKDLYVACTGDSRAVMGVRESSTKGGHGWKAVPLSFDQTGRNRWEVRRLQEEHPGEENTVVMRGRVLGGLGKLKKSASAGTYLYFLSFLKILD
jgi:serine/threonine protein phosphatase PrpC